MSWATLLTDGCSEAARTHVLTYGRPRITPRRDRCSTMLAPMSSEERSVLDRARADVVREECGARPCPRRRRPRRDRVAIRSRSSRDIERKAFHACTFAKCFIFQAVSQSPHSHRTVTAQSPHSHLLENKAFPVN